MPTLIPLAQPLQRSRIPLTTPPPRPISTPLSLPSTPEDAWQSTYMKRAKSETKMQEILNWRLINHNSK
jgi:hypothetical protein